MTTDQQMQTSRAGIRPQRWNPAGNNGIQLATGRIQLATGRIQLATGRIQLATGRIQLATGRIQPHYSRYTQNKVLLSVPCRYACEELFPQRLVVSVACLDFGKNNQIRFHYSRYTQNKVLLSVPCGYVREERFPQWLVVPVACLDFGLQQWNPGGNKRGGGKHQLNTAITIEFGSIIQGTLKTRNF